MRKLQQSVSNYYFHPQFKWRKLLNNREFLDQLYKSEGFAACERSELKVKIKKWGRMNKLRHTQPSSCGAVLLLLLMLLLMAQSVILGQVPNVFFLRAITRVFQPLPQHLPDTPSTPVQVLWRIRRIKLKMEEVGIRFRWLSAIKSRSPATTTRHNKTLTYLLFCQLTLRGGFSEVEAMLGK